MPLDTNISVIDTDKIFQSRLETLSNLNQVFTGNNPVASNITSDPIDSFKQRTDLTIREALTHPDWNIRNEANKLYEIQLKQNNPDYGTGLGTIISTPWEQAEKYSGKKYGFDFRMDNEQKYYEDYLKDPWYERTYENIGRFLGRGIISTGTKLVEGFGYIGAMLNPANYDGNFWANVADNTLSNLMLNWEKSAKNSDLLDVFHSYDYDQKGFFQKLGDATFWTDELADGAAFMASAMLPGMGLSKLGLIGKAGTLFGSANKFQQAVNKGAQFITGSKNWGELGIWALNTATEAAFETSEFYREQVRQLKETRPDLSENEIKLIAGENARNIFAGNLAVLSLSNAWENRMMFNPLNKKGTGVLSQNLDVFPSKIKMKDTGLGFETAISAKKGLDKFFDFSKDARFGFYGSRIAEGFISEGLWEENAQLAIQRMNSGDHLYYDEKKGDIFTNFLKQVGTQAYKGLTGEDKEASISIGLGAMLGSGMAVGMTKLFGGSNEKGESQFFKGERKSRIEKTEARVAKINDTISKFTSLTDIYNEDGTVNPVKFEAKKAAIESFINKQVSIDEIANPEFKKYLQNSLFSDYILSALQTGQFDNIINRLESIGLKTPEQIKELGLDPDNLKGSNAELIYYAKTLRNEWNKIKDISINPPLAKRKGYTEEELGAIDEDRRRLAFNFIAKNHAIQPLILSKVDESQKMAGELMKAITTESPELKSFADDVMNYNSSASEIEKLEQTYNSTLETEKDGKKTIENPKPKFYQKYLKEEIEKKKKELEALKKKIEESQKALNYTIKEENGKFVLSDNKDVNNIVNLYTQVKVSENLHQRILAESDFFAKSFLDIEKGLDNYKDYLGLINPIIEKVVNDELKNQINKLKGLGYTDEDINKMSAKEKDDIIKSNKKKENTPPPPTGDDEKTLYDKEGQNWKRNIGVTSELWFLDNKSVEEVVKTLSQKYVNENLKFRVVPNPKSTERIRNYTDDILMTVLEPPKNIIEFYIEENGAEKHIGVFNDPESVKHYKKNKDGKWEPLKISSLTLSEFSKLYTVEEEAQDVKTLEERYKNHLQLVTDLYHLKQKLINTPDVNLSSVLEIILSRGEFSFAQNEEDKITLEEFEKLISDSSGNYTILGIYDRSKFEKGDTQGAFEPLVGSEAIDVKLLKIFESDSFKNKLYFNNSSRYSAVIQTPNGINVVFLNQQIVKPEILDNIFSSLVERSKKTIKENINIEFGKTLIEEINEIFEKVKDESQQLAKIKAIVSPSLLKLTDDNLKELSVEFFKAGAGNYFTQITNEYYKNKRDKQDTKLVNDLESILSIVAASQTKQVKDNTFNDDFNEKINSQFFIATSTIIDGKGQIIPTKFELSLGISPKGSVRLIIETLDNNFKRRGNTENIYINLNENVDSFDKLLDIVNENIKKLNNNTSGKIVLTRKSFKQPLGVDSNRNDLLQLKTVLDNKLFKNPKIKVNPIKQTIVQPPVSKQQTKTQPSTQKGPELPKDIGDAQFDMFNKLEAMIASSKGQTPPVQTPPETSTKETNLNNFDDPNLGNDEAAYEAWKISEKEYDKSDIIDALEFNSFMKESLPESLFSIEDVDKITIDLNSKNITVGKFTMSLSEVGEVKGTITTVNGAFKYHEAFHGIFRMLLNNEEQINLRKEGLKEIYENLRKKEISLNDELIRFKSLNSRYSQLSDVELKDLYIEEYIADRFQDWKKEQYKPTTIIGKFFKLIQDLFNYLFSTNKINKFFRDVDKGKLKNRTIQRNSFTDKLLEDGFGELEANKILYIKNVVKDSTGKNKVVESFLSDSDNQILIGTILTNFIKEYEKTPNKNQLLNNILDDIKNTITDRTIPIGSAVYYEKSRNEIKKSVDEILNYLGYQSSLESEEYEDLTNDEGDRSSTDKYSSSENFGGFKSLSREIREYLTTITDVSSIQGLEETLEGRPIYSQLFVPFVYNGLLKSTAGYITQQEFLNRIKFFSEYNSNTRTFALKFFEDIFGEKIGDFNKFIPLVENVKNGTLFNLFTAGFQTVVNPYIITGHTKDQAVIFIDANSKNSAKLQFQNWSNDFVRKSREIEDPTIRNGLLNILEKEIKSTFDTLSYTGKYKDGLKRYLQKFSNQYQDLTGIRLEASILELTLLRFVTDRSTLTQEQNMFLDTYQSIPSVDIKDIIQISTSIRKGENPFIAFYETNEDGTTDLKSTGAKTRLLNLAIINSSFNELVWDTVFINADGEKVWTHQNPTYHHEILNQIKKGIRTPETSVLFEKEKLQQVLPFIKLFRNGGLKTVALDKNGEVNESLEVNKAPGKTYGKFKTVDLWRNLASYYVNYREIQGVGVTAHLTRVLEASNTGDMIELPVIKTLNNLGELQEEAIETFEKLYLQEVKRIYDNIIDILTNPNRQIIDNVNGKIGDRGTKFFNMREILGESLSTEIENRLVDVIGEFNDNQIKIPSIEEILGSEFTNLKDVYQSYTDTYINNSLNNMVEEGVIRREEGKAGAINFVNQLLPKEFYEGHKDSNTNSKLNLEKNTHEGFRRNIGRFLINDLLNTMMFNDMIFNTKEYIGLKDPIDIIKRAKGLNAGGASIYTEAVAPELGIYHATDKIDIIERPSFEYYSSIKQDVQDRMDGESFGSEKFLRHIMFALGKLDKKTASIYDRIINGNESVEDVFGKEGLISYNRQMSVLKLVYFDAWEQKYIKTSVKILTKKLTSIKNEKGEWVARPGYEELHKLREELEELEGKNIPPEQGRLVWVATSGASKMKKILGNNGQFEDLLLNKDTLQTNFSTKFLRLQTENPSNKQGGINDPSQNKHIIDTEMDEMFEVVINGDVKKLGEVREEYHKLQSQRDKVAYLQNRNSLFSNVLRNELDKSITVSEVTPKLENFRKMAVETLKKTGASSNLIEFFEKGFNLNHPIVREKFEELLSSIISKNGFKSKVNGHSFTLAADYGIRMAKIARIKEIDGKRIVGWDYIQRHIVESNIDKFKGGEKKYKTPNIKEAPDEDSIKKYRQNFLDSLIDGEVFFDELQHNVPEYDQNGNIIGYYSEVIIPPHNREIAEMIEMGQVIPSAMLIGLGIRIPSQDKHSNMSVRVVDFAPAHMGSMIYAPKELIEISGADFDVDKLYTKLLDIYFEKMENGEYEIKYYGQEGNYSEFLTWNLKNNTELKSRINEIKEKSSELKFVDKQLRENRRERKLIPFIKEKIRTLKESKKKNKKEAELINKLYSKIQFEINNEEDLKSSIEYITGLIESGKYSKEEVVILEKDLKVLNRAQEENDEFYNIKSTLDKKDITLKGINTKIEKQKQKIVDLKATNQELWDFRNLILVRIEKQALEELELPASEKEYQDLNLEHGEQNIGTLNNDILASQIIMQSNPWIVENGIDIEYASMDMFKNEFRNDPDLIPGLNKQPALNPNSTLGKITHQKSNKEGAIGIGPAVNSMLVYTLFHKYGVKLKEGFTFEGKEYKDYSSDKTESGRRIFNIISQVVSAMTDNAKERIAYEFNLPIEAVGTFIHMVSLGMNEKVAQGILLTRPIKDYLKLRSKKLQPKKDIRQSLFASYPINSEGEVDLTSQSIYTLIKTSNEKDGNIDSSVANRVLKFYFDREDEAELFNVIDILKLTKGLSDGFNTIEKIQSILEEIGYQESKFSLPVVNVKDNKATEKEDNVWEGIADALKQHFLNQNLQQVNEFAELAKTVSIRATNLYKSIETGILSQTSIRNDFRDNFRRDFLNNMLAYFSLILYKKNSQGRPIHSKLSTELLIGDNNIIQIIEKGKQLYKSEFDKPSNLLEKYIRTIPVLVTQKVNGENTLVENPENKSGFNMINSNTFTKFDEAEIDLIRSEFQNMATSTNIELRDTAMSIFAYSLVKDGGLFKANTVLNFIPPALMKGYIQTLDVLQEVFLLSDNFKDVKELDKKYNDLFLENYGKSFSILIDDFTSLLLEDINYSFYNRQANIARVKQQVKYENNVSIPISDKQYEELRIAYDKIPLEKRPKDEKGNPQENPYTATVAKALSKNGDGTAQEVEVNVLKGLKFEDFNNLSREDWNFMIKFLGGKKEGIKRTKDEFIQKLSKNIKDVNKLGFQVIKNTEGKIVVLFPKVVKNNIGTKDNPNFVYYKLKSVNEVDPSKTYNNLFLPVGTKAIYEQFEPEGSRYLSPLHKLFGEPINYVRKTNDPDYTNIPEELQGFFTGGNIDEFEDGSQQQSPPTSISTDTISPQTQQPTQNVNNLIDLKLNKGEMVGEEADKMADMFDNLMGMVSNIKDNKLKEPCNGGPSI